MRTDTSISKRDLIKANIRWILTSQICWNYERMMSAGYLNTMLPLLQRFYKHKPDLQEMMKTHNQFFNTNPQVGGLIVGMNIALEEQQGIEAQETAAAIKTGLMGPFAGVGDTFFGVIFPTIFGAIASYMALEGNIIGTLLFVLVNIALIGVRWTFLPLGYREGTKIVAKYSHHLNLLTESAILLGMTVVGALIPTVIRAKVPFIYQSGEVELKLQSVLDQIVPNLIPVLVVGLVYYLLGKKSMNSTKAIFLIVLLSIILYNLGILS